MKLRYIALALSCAAALGVFAATPVPASGSGGGVSWSLAPMAATTVATADGALVLTQGTLNATDIAVAGIEAASAESDLKVCRYGSSVAITTSAPARWTIYSILGTVVSHGQVPAGRSEISLAGLAPAMYILTVADSRAMSQTLKIVVE